MDQLLTSRLFSMPKYDTLLACTSVIIILWGLLLWRKKTGKVKILEQFPSPEKNFIFGNTLQLERDPSDLRDQLIAWSRYYNNGLFVLWLGPFEPFLYMYRPDLVEILLSNSRHISKSFVYTFLHPWLGTGLLTSTGAKWKKRRRQITPTFHFKILNDFIQVFEEESKTLVSVLKSICNEGTMDIFPLVTKCALDIICKSSMGKSVNAQQGENATYVNAVTRISELLQIRQRSPWLWPDLIYNLTPSGQLHNKYLEILHGLTNQVIDERMAERKSTLPKEEENKVDEFTGKRKRRPLAFLDLLLDAYDDGQIDREGIREEVDTFMFEGHDTTAAAMTWALMLLGLHPDVQQKVQEEVDAFFESRPEIVTVDDLKELKYLECVIKETLRLYPSVPFFARQLSEDFDIEGVRVPKGTTVGVAPVSLHSNPDVWPDPEKFDPDRFLPENSEGRHPYAFVPFSAGPRNCIGQRFAILEEKIVLANVLHHFTVKTEAKSRDEIKVCAEIVTRPKDGIFATLTPRN